MSDKPQEMVSMIIEDHYIDVEKSVADLLKEPPVDPDAAGRPAALDGAKDGRPVVLRRRRCVAQAPGRGQQTQPPGPPESLPHRDASFPQGA